MDYKFTINLPKTTFLMKANLSKMELNLISFWNNINLYNNQCNSRLFLLNDGPPYANGNIHIGHAFNKILKDFICKFKILSGYKINFIPGWDCHGLPIELNVEKKYSSKLNLNKFRQLCKHYALSQIKLQMISFKRLGILCDWQNHYKTLDKSFETSIIKSFFKILETGYLYIGYRPNYWCFKCTSSLAEAEIEYYNKESYSIYLFFPINNILKYNLSTIGFLIWTTTPWTIPFNEAIAINKKFNYLLISVNNTGYIISSNLYKTVLKKIGIIKYTIIDQLNESFFKNIKIYHPFYKKNITLVFSNHVRNDSGTGCVHIAPSYGYDDYKLALKYNLKIKNTINNKGFFYNTITMFANLYYLNINIIVINLLIKNKTLIFKEFIIHRYPHCWRHKTELIFRTTKQWFFNINFNLIKKKMMYFSDNIIKWIPDNGITKMNAMLSDRFDWCISRQRYWGIPIILFLDCNDKLHPNTKNILNQSINFIKKYGTDFWYNCDVFNLFNINKNKYRKVSDVLDVWFDSSVVYRYMYDYYNHKIPHDLCLEGNDQYRGWFQVSLINSVSNFSITPYKTILSHGFILDNKGRKMSKSLNNIILPSDIINKYGADILRLWASSVNYSHDITISNEILLRICDAYRKIRNTFRFLLSNLYDFNKIDILNYNNFSSFDLWILKRLNYLKNEILNNYYNFNFHLIYKKIYNFCVEDLGAKYLDIVKDTLYTYNYHSNNRKNIQVVFFYILYNLLKLISPILSFTSEEAWEKLNIKESLSIFKSTFNLDVIIFKTFNTFPILLFFYWLKLFFIKDIINKNIELNRKKYIIGTSLDINIFIFCNIFWFSLLNKFKTHLTKTFQVSSVNLILCNTYLPIFSKYKIKGLFFIINKSSYNKCERCWNKFLKNYNINICLKCLHNMYYI